MIRMIQAIVIAAFLLPLVTAFADNIVSRPVGVLQIKVSEKAQRLVSLPFQPFSNTLDVVLSGQMTGSTSEKSADHVFKWDAFISAYRKAVKADGTGNPELDGKWVADLQGMLPSDLTLEPGEGFFLENRQGSTQSVFLVGKVMLDDANPVLFLPALNLFGSQYPASVSPDAVSLPAGAGDQVMSAEDANSPAFLEPGRGYWYNRKAEDAIVWTEVRPFANPFPANDEPPSIELVSITAQKEAVLSIRCAGEKLDIYFKDAAPADRFDPTVGWRIAESDMAVTGKSSIQWTDNGGPGRLPVKDVFARYYIVARADIDQDEDGVPDARNQFVLGGDPVPVRTVNTTVIEPIQATATADPASTNGLAISGTNVISNPVMIRSRIIYVDRQVGADALSGRSPVVVAADGPKKTIKAGLVEAGSGDTVIIKAGIYSEDINIAGKDVSVRIEGNVHLGEKEAEVPVAMELPSGTNVSGSVTNRF